MKKPMFEKSFMVPPFKVAQATWDRIPGNRCAFIREAIAEKLEREEASTCWHCDSKECPFEGNANNFNGWCDAIGGYKNV